MKGIGKYTKELATATAATDAAETAAVAAWRSWRMAETEFERTLKKRRELEMKVKGLMAAKAKEVAK
jgi:hypothetical protein